MIWEEMKSKHQSLEHYNYYKLAGK